MCFSTYDISNVHGSRLHLFVSLYVSTWNVLLVQSIQYVSTYRMLLQMWLAFASLYQCLSSLLFDRRIGLVIGLNPFRQCLCFCKVGVLDLVGLQLFMPIHASTYNADFIQLLQVFPFLPDIMLFEVWPGLHALHSCPYIFLLSMWVGLVMQ